MKEFGKHISFDLSTFCQLLVSVSFQFGLLCLTNRQTLPGQMATYQNTDFPTDHVVEEPRVAAGGALGCGIETAIVCW